MDNKSILAAFFSFLGGAAIGGFVGYKIAEKKERAIAQEEIDSVKAKFTVPRVEKKTETVKNPEGKNLSNKALNKPSLVEYTKKLKEGGYTNYSNSKDEPKKESSAHYPWDKDMVYVIPPEDFGNDDDYSEVTLTFYADGILADEDDVIIENVEEVVGDALSHIGKYEDDAVHVCNKNIKVYYEILEVEESYEKATGKKPHLDKDDGEDK